MDDKMIQAQGGLYTPEELAAAYAERGDRIEELSRNNSRLEARLAELEKVADAVTVLMDWANRDRADNADLEERLDSLEADQRDCQSEIEEVRSDLEEAAVRLDEAISRIRDAAAELASV